MMKLKAKYNEVFKNLDIFQNFLFKSFAGAKLEKQMNSIKDKYVKSQLEKFYLSQRNQVEGIKIERIVNAIDQYIDKIRPIILKIIKKRYVNKTEKEDAYRFVQLLQYSCIGITLIYMDVFLLSRLFRTFKFKKNYYSGEPSNVFIYVGDEHADKYTLTKYLKFELLFEIKDKSSKLDMNNRVITFDLNT
jgi:isoleucyl-tRNA synthetase